MNLHTSLNLLRQRILWVWRWKFHILSILSVIITMFYLVRVLNFLPKYIGAAFAITGLILLLVQLRLDANEFASQSPNTIRNWIKSFPIGKAQTIYAQAGISSTISIKGHLSVDIPQDDTIERKIGFLFNRVQEIQKYIDSVDDKLDQVEKTFDSKTKELKSLTENLKDITNKVIAGHAVGVYDVNLLGIVLTISGTMIQLFRA